MPLTRLQRALLGVSAILPIFLYVCMLPLLMTRGDRVAAAIDGALADPNSLALAPLVLVAALTTAILIYGPMVFFMIHAVRNPALRGGKVAAWVLGLFFANLIAYPIYWFNHVLHGPGRCEYMPGRRSSALPIILSTIPIVVFVAMVVAAAALESSGVDPESVGMVGGLVFDLAFFPIWIYTIVKAIKNPALSAGRRAIWVVVLLFLGLLTMPAYWIIEARRAPTNGR